MKRKIKQKLYISLQMIILVVLNSTTTFALFSTSTNYQTELNPVRSTSTATSASFRLTSQIRDIQTIAQGTTLQIDHIEMPPNKIGFCGDGNIDPGEQCDGVNFGGQTCNSNGFDSGNLTCNACLISTANCSNNGGGDGIVISPPEKDTITNNTSSDHTIVPNPDKKDIEKQTITIKNDKPKDTVRNSIKILEVDKGHASADNIPIENNGYCEDIKQQLKIQKPNNCTCQIQESTHHWYICIIAFILILLNLILTTILFKKLNNKKDKKKSKK